jgi:hypothetical protein
MTDEEIMKIGKEKFEEWEINKYSKSQIKEELNYKWRN